MDSKVFQAAKIEEDDGGQSSGGNERMRPLGSPDKAVEMPAI
jgi:hypothetical protein